MVGNNKVMEEINFLHDLVVWERAFTRFQRATGVQYCSISIRQSSELISLVDWFPSGFHSNLTRWFIERMGPHVLLLLHVNKEQTRVIITVFSVMELENNHTSHKKSCSVPNCGSKDQKLFQLPKNEPFRSEWMRLCHVSTSTKRCINVCARHFKPEDFSSKCKCL